MEFREKSHTDKYKGIKRLELCRQLYAYVTSGLGLRKFRQLDFCCTGCK
jgi:hypothetical protein